jgi:hypothetical protein
MNTEKEDIPVMLDCLHELFNEYGDGATPTLRGTDGKKTV